MRFGEVSKTFHIVFGHVHMFNVFCCVVIVCFMICLVCAMVSHGFRKLPTWFNAAFQGSSMF